MTQSEGQEYNNKVCFAHDTKEVGSEVVFSSLTFLLFFFPIFLTLYFFRRNLKWRNGILLIASLIFYGWSDPVWILAMLFTTLVNYICAKNIARQRNRSVRQSWTAIAVLVSLGFLFYFKYADFTVNSIRSLLHLPRHDLGITLPIGISFYTFQILTYTIDVYRGKCPVQKRFSSLLLYVSCFPQLIAGPIVQYTDVAERIDRRHTSMEDFSQGMRRFAVGLSKKVLLANLCGSMLEQTTLAGSGSPLSFGGAWLSAFLYALQLYFDFSAYSDMAIGIGRILGFTYKENFDHPYASRSVSEFWRRWHISLGSFFREYVYIPLGGNRRGGARTALNLLIVWALTGLWHGASWNFAVWGLYYGVLQLLERFVFRSVIEKTPSPIRWALTFVITLVGWVIFYYTDFSLVTEHLMAMAGLAKTSMGYFRADFMDAAGRAVLEKYTVYPLIAFLCSLPIVPALKKHLGNGAGERAANAATTLLLTALVALSVIFLIGQSYNPFIYFRF